ncbi:hypothetical protein Q5752_002448 [Cryptotrichosporon argae]
MAFHLHPLLSTYPGASFHPIGTGPHLALASGGPSLGYWGAVPCDPPPAPPEWTLPPAVVAALEGRGTGVYGLLPEGTGEPYRYGMPKYGPMPLKPELGGFVGKLNPFGRSFPHGYYKTVY